MTTQYFGTDGIRGRVGEHPITAEFTLKLGGALGRVLTERMDERCMVVIGKDTRISGYLFESALESGLAAAGVDVLLLGPMPTPAVAHLTRSLGGAAGIVISASHNSFHDNGIKFFSAHGRKLPDSIQQQIEQQLNQPFTHAASEQLGKARRLDDASGRYVEYCKGTVAYGTRLEGLKIVLGLREWCNLSHWPGGICRAGCRSHSDSSSARWPEYQQGLWLDASRFDVSNRGRVGR